MAGNGPFGKVGPTDPGTVWGNATNTSGEVTPDDAAAQEGMPCRGLWVGGAGTLVLTDDSDNQVVLENATGWMPGRWKRVKVNEDGGARTTTATNIVPYS